MKFIGTGPGVGIELKHGAYAGRLIFPIYYTNGDNKQSSANIYSDDGGLTWHRGESPNDGRTNSSGQVSDSQEMNGLTELTESQIVELNNGHLLQFMRNLGGPGKVAVAVSTDGGETWGEVSYTEATEVYCQLSVIHYPELIDGNECVILSNPGGSGRNNGTLRIGKVKEDDSIEWIHTKMFCPGNYAYSSLTAMEDGNLGLLYEHNNTIKFTSFNTDYIKDPVVKLHPSITQIQCSVDRADPGRTSILPGDTMNLTVTLDQNVYTTGAPSLRLNFNGIYRHAAYVSGGEGDKQMEFSYVVQEGDEGTISFLGPKIVCDAQNHVKNKSGLTVSSGDLSVNLGTIGKDPTMMNGDIPKEYLSASAGSAQSGEGPENVLDGDPETLWHTLWSGSPRENHWICFDLGEEYTVKGLRYLPRNAGGTNGIITRYRIEVSSDNQEFTPVSEGDWEADTEWKKASFEEIKARYVRLVSVESVSQEANKEFTSAAEIRIQAREFERVEAPSDLSVTEITHNSALLRWKEPEGELAAKSYQIAYGPEGEEKTTVSTQGLEMRLENLKSETTYEVEAAAVGENGNLSEVSKLIFTTGKETPVVKPADKKALEISIQKARGYLEQKDLYESSSLKGLETVLAQAQALYGKENAEQEEVDAMVQKLEEAIRALVPVKNPQPSGEEQLTSIQLSKKKKTLGAGESWKLKVIPSPAGAKTGSVKWKSSNKKVATVSAKGVVKAKRKGKATITVTAANGKKVSCKITVKKAPKSVTIKARKKTLKVKKTLQLKAVLSKGSAGKVTFRSKNKKVATVTASGRVTAKKKGKAVIQVRTYNHKKAAIRLTVK